MKPFKLLAAMVILLVALGGASLWVLSSSAQPQEKSDPAILLSHREPSEVSSVQVENSHGSYTYTRTQEGFRLHDLPLQRVNQEYVAMLLDESSRVECLKSVTRDLSQLSNYGLADPEARVTVSYDGGRSLCLLIGTQEPISGGRYCMEAEGDQVFIMKNNRTIRFTMPVEKYLDYIIIPPEESTSVLSVLQDMTFSGTSLPAPIRLRAVLPQREDTQLEALSFGAVTHLVEGPVLHEANSTALIQIAEDLLGLISEGVVDYNCTQEELEAYGFDQPWLQLDFDYKNGPDAPVNPYSLRVSPWEDGYIVTVNDDGIVYRILDLSFLHPTYEDLTLRWFYSPFLTDLSAVELTRGGETTRFDLSGDHAKDLSVACGGQQVDAESFRSFFRLLTSAAADGPLAQNFVTAETAPLLTVRYLYRNPDKSDDTLSLYPGPTRRLCVETNGAREFTMRENFLTVCSAGLDALLTGTSFSTDW